MLKQIRYHMVYHGITLYHKNLVCKQLSSSMKHVSLAGRCLKIQGTNWLDTTVEIASQPGIECVGNCRTHFMSRWQHEIYQQIELIHPSSKLRDHPSMTPFLGDDWNILRYGTFSRVLTCLPLCYETLNSSEFARESLDRNPWPLW